MIIHYLVLPLQWYHDSYDIYCLVAISLFATFALFGFQLSINLLDANKNKLLLLLLLLICFNSLMMFNQISTCDA